MKNAFLTCIAVGSVLGTYAAWSAYMAGWSGDVSLLGFIRYGPIYGILSGMVSVIGQVVLRANPRFGVFCFFGAGAFIFLLTAFVMSLRKSETFSHVASAAIFGVFVGGIAQICQYVAPNSPSQRKR